MYALTSPEIESLLNKAREGDERARNDLIAGLKPYVHRVCSRRSGRFLAWENDDELGIGLLALNEAIEAFTPGLGTTFTSFSAKVIDRRLIDYLRQQQGHRSVTVTLDDQVDILAAPQQEENLELALAVEEFARELGAYKVSPEDLVRSSPKHRDTRETLTRVARHLVQHQELREQFFRYHQLPLAELCAETGVSRRVLERGRRYVVALVLILARDIYYPLRSFAGLVDNET